MFEDLDFGFLSGDSTAADLNSLSGSSNLFDVGDIGGFDFGAFTGGGEFGGDVLGGAGPDFSSILGAFSTPSIPSAPFQGLIPSTPTSLPTFQSSPVIDFASSPIFGGLAASFSPENQLPLQDVSAGLPLGGLTAPPFIEPGGEGLVPSGPAPLAQAPSELSPEEVAPPILTPEGIAQIAASQSPTPWDPRTWNWNPFTWDARTLGLVLGLGTTAVGLVGLIQRMMQGDAAARVEVTRRFNEGTPEERAAITAALQGMQRLAQSPTGGINPLSPEIAALVEQAYQPALQGIATQAIEAARRAGFHHDPLTSPVGGALAGPALAQLQGQIAQSKLALSQAIAQQQMGGFQNLGNLARGGQQGFTQTQQGPSPTLLDAYGDLSKILGNLATGLGTYGATRPQRR